MNPKTQPPLPYLRKCKDSISNQKEKKKIRERGFPFLKLSSHLEKLEIKINKNLEGHPFSKTKLKCKTDFTVSVSAQSPFFTSTPKETPIYMLRSSLLRLNYKQLLSATPQSLVYSFISNYYCNKD